MQLQYSDKQILEILKYLLTYNTGVIKSLLCTYIHEIESKNKTKKSLNTELIS